MISLLTVGMAPAIALLCFFYLKDEYEQEPIHMVIRCFIFGSLLVFPILFIQYALQEEGVIQSVVMEAFIQTAFTEEFIKWFIIMLTVYSHINFNQRYDGIVYGTAVALGFASVENILYLFSYGLETAFLRALFPLSSHALFGVVMGYYIGKAKFNQDKKYRYLFYSFLFPYLLHGFYNFILLNEDQWSFFLVPFMIYLWLLGLRKIKKANQLQASFFSKNMAS